VITPWISRMTNLTFFAFSTANSLFIVYPLILFSKSEIPACGRQANIEIRNKSKILMFQFLKQIQV
jgi:hypothetical protein